MPWDTNGTAIEIVGIRRETKTNTWHATGWTTKKLLNKDDFAGFRKKSVWAAQSRPKDCPAEALEGTPGEAQGRPKRGPRGAKSSPKTLKTGAGQSLNTWIGFDLDGG